SIIFLLTSYAYHIWLILLLKIWKATKCVDLEYYMFLTMLNKIHIMFVISFLLVTNLINFECIVVKVTSSLITRRDIRNRKTKKILFASFHRVIRVHARAHKIDIKGIKPSNSIYVWIWYWTQFPLPNTNYELWG
ncbi:hypothetical protein ACJX0J_019307, partial [Zea mays]